MTDTLETTTTELPSVPTAPAAPRPPRNHGLLLAALVGVLAIGTAASVFTWLSGPEPAASSSPAPPAADTLEVDRPGGSVYDQQVPAQARVDDWTIGYGPGSQTHREQVPTGAGSIWTEGYWPGSGTYEQQVPGAEDWTTGYAPGSSTYEQQVPSGAR